MKFFYSFVKVKNVLWNRIIPRLIYTRNVYAKKRILLVKITNSNVNKLSSINLIFFFFPLCFLRPILYHPFLFFCNRRKVGKENNISEISLFFFFVLRVGKIIKSAEVYDTMGSKQIIINFLFFLLIFFNKLSRFCYQSFRSRNNSFIEYIGVWRRGI